MNHIAFGVNNSIPLVLLIPEILVAGFWCFSMFLNFKIRFDSGAVMNAVLTAIGGTILLVIGSILLVIGVAVNFLFARSTPYDSSDTLEKAAMSAIQKDYAINYVQPLATSLNDSNHSFPLLAMDRAQNRYECVFTPTKTNRTTYHPFFGQRRDHVEGDVVCSGIHKNFPKR